MFATSYKSFQFYVYITHDPHISATTALHEEGMVHTSMTIISISFICISSIVLFFCYYSLILQFIGTSSTCKPKSLNKLFLMTNSISIIAFIEFRSFSNFCVRSPNIRKSGPLKRKLFGSLIYVSESVR